MKASATAGRGAGVPAPALPTFEDGALAAEQQAALDQATLLAIHEQFDQVTAERSEQMRESDAMQTLLMAELKNADDLLKKWIAMI